MRRTTRITNGFASPVTTATLALASIGAITTISAGDCWWNDMEPNGLDLRGTSPPAFPDVRVVDDFWIPPDSSGPYALRVVHAEDATWSPGDDTIEVYIYRSGLCACPEILWTRFETTDVSREFQGYQIFGRDVYEYEIDVSHLELPPGRYHVGTRWPNGTGSGSTYWLTSSGGPGNESTGCVSLDGGATWDSEDAGRHYAFEIDGCSVPCIGCPGDIDRDCDIDFADLLSVLEGWGPIELPPTCCWDNDLELDGFGARPTSPPGFPDVRVTDDFTVPDQRSAAWTLDGFRQVCAEDDGWDPGDGTVEVYLYRNFCQDTCCPTGCETPADSTTIVVDDAERTFEGFQLFDRDVYTYWIPLDGLRLESGTYHIGSRWPDAGGTGSTYWLTSAGGAGGDVPGCVSFDGGASWETEGAGWNHAFSLEGAHTCADPRDADDDCDIDFSDLLFILNRWGPCQP